MKTKPKTAASTSNNGKDTPTTTTTTGYQLFNATGLLRPSSSPSPANGTTPQSSSSSASGPLQSQMMLRSQCRSSPIQQTHHSPRPQSQTMSLLFVFSLLLVVQQVIFVRYYINPKIQAYEQAKALNTKLVRLLDNMEHDKLNCITRNEALELVNEKVNLYDADKTFKADYALESSGATIIATRCTKNYPEKNIRYSINGLVPILFTSNSPRVVIQPTIAPGDCWSFAGGQGNMVVQLSRTIIPTSFTYEHIRKQLSPDLNIDSAPNYFKVKSLSDSNDREGLLLGEYYYDKDGDPLQQFEVQNPNPLPTRFIELTVLSNHGEMQYTCLYRFRVHGQKY